LTQGDRRLKCHDDADEKTEQRDDRQRVDADLFGDEQCVAPANCAGVARRLDHGKAELADEANQFMNIFPNLRRISAYLLDQLDASCGLALAGFTALLRPIIQQFLELRP